MVKKTDWNGITDMPKETDCFVIKKQLSETDIAILKEGHHPEEMEDKWFMYYEDNKFYFHRSWTGICIYIVSMIEGTDELEVVVNRNPEEYKETSIEQDKMMLNIIINGYLNNRTENMELMKNYIQGKNKKN